jgi:hypothetical protein
MRFKYSTTSSTQNEFDSLPRLPLSLRREAQSVEAVGLVDSGATVNVLPYEFGLQLGGIWDERRAIIQLASNLGSQPAMPLSAISYATPKETLRSENFHQLNWCLLG